MQAVCKICLLYTSLTGMVLMTITLNFWNLNYLLPLIGIILSLLGFRTLSHENGWLKACYRLTVLRTGFIVMTLLLNTSIRFDVLMQGGIQWKMTLAGCILPVSYTHLCNFAGGRGRVL